MNMATIPHTDPTRWRLHTYEGVHNWRYVDNIESTSQPQSTPEKYFLGLPTVCEICVYSILFNALTNKRRGYHVFLPLSTSKNPLGMDFVSTRTSN